MLVEENGCLVIETAFCKGLTKPQEKTIKELHDIPMETKNKAKANNADTNTSLTSYNKAIISKLGKELVGNSLEEFNH